MHSHEEPYHGQERIKSADEILNEEAATLFSRKRGYRSTIDTSDLGIGTPAVEVAVLPMSSNIEDCLTGIISAVNPTSAASELVSLLGAFQLRNQHSNKGGLELVYSRFIKDPETGQTYSEAYKPTGADAELLHTLAQRFTRDHGLETITQPGSNDAVLVELERSLQQTESEILPGITQTTSPITQEQHTDTSEVIADQQLGFVRKAAARILSRYKKS